MTSNQKILLGVGAIALAYLLYSKKSSGVSRQAPITPKKDNDANFSNLTSSSTRQSCARMFCLKDCIDTPRGGRCTV